jgi:hypothetical protein
VEESSQWRFARYVHVKNWNFLFYCSNIAKSENAMLWRMLSRLETCIVYSCRFLSIQYNNNQTVVEYVTFIEQKGDCIIRYFGRPCDEFAHVKNWNFLFYCSNIAKSENAMLWRMLSRLETCIVYSCIWKSKKSKHFIPVPFSAKILEY